MNGQDEPGDDFGYYWKGLGKKETRIIWKGTFSVSAGVGKDIKKTELESEDSHGEDNSEETDDFCLLLSIARDCQHK
jgi:hypothetical protein